MAVSPRSLESMSPRPSPGAARAFVGRDDELARLRTSVTDTPSVAIVDGEAGVGKSRLVEQLLAELAGHRMTPLVGRCLVVQEPLPLAPLLDAVRAAADRLPLVQRLDPVVGALSTLVGDLGDRLPPALPPLADPRAELHRIFVAASVLLRECGPAVLVLEDVHWADPQTWEFLAFLVANQPETLSLVLTVRSNAVETLPVWEPLRRAAAGPATRIGLRPLPPGDVGRLASDILGVDTLPDPLVASLCEKTAGIPFVVEEVLNTLLQRIPADDAVQRVDPLRDLEVPTALRDVIRQRLSSLAEPGPDVLGAAAVFGSPIDEDLLARVTGRDREEVVRALAGALSLGIVYEDAGRCRFRHDLAEQIVYEALPAPTRRWWHGRAAEALEGRSEPLPVAQLAHHHRQAGNAAAFVRYAEAAADLASSHGDDATASTFLLDTMEVDDLPNQTKTRLAIRLGHSAVDGLAQAETVPVLERLLTDGQLSGGDRGQVRFLLGRLLRQQGQLLRGHMEIEQAVPDLEAAPDLQARALAVLAVPDTVVGRHVDEHRRRCDQAAEAATRDPRGTADLAVRIARISLWMETGDARCWSAIDELRVDLALRANPREHARACLNWAQGAWHVGQVTRAAALLDEGRRVVEAAGYLRVASVLELVGAEVDRAAGRWDGLEARIRRLARAPSGYPAASLDSRFLLGAHLVGVGSVDEAETVLREVIQTAERMGAVWPLVPAWAWLSRLLFTADRRPAALDAALAGVREARAKGNWIWGADSVLAVVDAAVALGRPEPAREAVEELADGLGDADAPLAQAAVEVCRVGLDGLDADRLDTIQRRLAAAGSPYDEAAAHERLGRWLCAAGDRGDDLLVTALRGFDALGATRDVGRVRHAMRRHGVAVPYPWRGGRRSYGAALSPREREVARLAAAGKTNQEIAADLFLSPRTVETHVANALRKLGGSSRKELGDLLPDADD